MKKRSSKASAAALYAVASKQQGYFTAKQAKTAGYSDAVHGYHLKNGDWERRLRGIYRLVLFPPPATPALVEWSLWSRDRSDRPQGIFSHETARALHEGRLQDDTPLHMTVPGDFRKGTALPADLELYYADLDPADIEHREGYAVTTPARTARDLGRTAEPRKPPAPRPEPAAAPPKSRPKPAQRDWAVW